MVNSKEDDRSRYQHCWTSLSSAFQRLTLPKPTKPACSKPVFNAPLSFRSIHTPHARARTKLQSQLWLVFWPCPEAACSSPRSVLTFALTDSQWGLGLNDLLRLSPALRGSRCPQGQDGQQHPAIRAKPYRQPESDSWHRLVSSQSSHGMPGVLWLPLKNTNFLSMSFSS